VRTTFIQALGIIGDVLLEVNDEDNESIEWKSVPGVSATFSVSWFVSL
jgi:hypothetical protein